MKFRCYRDVLAEALAKVGWATTRVGHPALGGVLMEATTDTGLTLTTTDLEVSARLTVDMEVSSSGVALVPARMLTDMVKNLPDALVTFEADGAQAQIRCAGYEATLRLLHAEDFPAVQPPVGAPVVLPADEFVQAVGQVAKAASRDEARPVLTGVLVELDHAWVTFVATDSYRLALRRVVTPTQGGQAIVPRRALTEAARRAKGADEVRLVLQDTQVSFQVDGLTLISRLIEGNYPNYREILPEAYENRLTVSRQQLMDAVRRVGLLARDASPVRMEFNALGVKLSSQSPDLGQAVEAVEARYEGEELTAAYNPTYLLDGLAAASGETVRIEVRDGMKPMVLRGEQDDFTYLLMPIRRPSWEVDSGA